MSTSPAPVSTPTDAECAYEHCDEHVPPGEGYDEADTLCSADCKYRRVARGLLQDIKYDHRFCASCHRKIRDVYPPGRRFGSKHVIADSENDETATMTEIPECAVGYAVPRPGTQRGLSEHLEPRDPTHGDWEMQPSDDDHLRQICECGAGHHQTRDRPLPLGDLMDAGKHLSSTLDERLSEDKHSYLHDRDVLLDEIRERKTDPDNHGTPDQQILINSLAEAIMAAKPYR